MAESNPRITGINSEWLVRDTARYIVRVPTPGGSANFNFKEYGGTAKALQAAKKFQRAALKQKKFDDDFYKKTGDIIAREHIAANNTSGTTGVSRTIYPNGFSQPRIVWCAHWSRGKGRSQGRKCFSTADPGIKNEKDAEQKAKAKRKEMKLKKFK